MSSTHLWRPGYSPQSLPFRHPWGIAASFAVNQALAPTLEVGIGVQWHTPLTVAWGIGLGAYSCMSSTFHDDLANISRGPIAVLPTVRSRLQTAKTWGRGIGATLIVTSFALTCAQLIVDREQNRHEELKRKYDERSNLPLGKLSN